MNEKPQLIHRKNLFKHFAGIDELDFVYPKSSVRIKRFVVTRPDAAAILLYHRDNDSLVFIRQFRAPVFTKNKDGYVIEIPAGIIEDGESPAQSISRETLEETGYRIDNPQLLNMIYPSCGLLNERIYLFYHEVNANDKVADGGGLDSENEYLDIVEIPVSKVFEMVTNQELVDGKTLSALLHFRINIYKK